MTLTTGKQDRDRAYKGSLSGTVMAGASERENIASLHNAPAELTEYTTGTKHSTDLHSGYDTPTCYTPAFRFGSGGHPGRQA